MYWSEATTFMLAAEANVAATRVPVLLTMDRTLAASFWSIFVVSITAHMQDYLAKRNTDEVVEGGKKFKDVETVWTFALVEGSWRVSNIEEAPLSLAYAKLTTDLPAIESTLAPRSEG